jgi:tRNA modification GTPase
VGRPNVGKSSLLNAWSRSDRAIVTELPGTTRDVVESQLVVQGIPVQVLDTAGIREASDQVEKMGVQRSREAAEKADLILLAIDAQAGWTQEDAEIYYNVNQRPVILVVNKVDLLDGGDKNQLQEIENAIAGDGNFIQIVKTAAAKPEGIDQLENAIAQAVHTGNLQAADTDLAINQRQAAALTRAKNALEQVQKAIADDLPLDFWTIDLREATQAFGEVTGDEITESMLDRIFSRFCIGK